MQLVVLTWENVTFQFWRFMQQKRVSTEIYSEYHGLKTEEFLDKM